MPNPIEDYRESIIPEETEEEATETTEEVVEEKASEEVQSGADTGQGEEVDKFKDKSKDEVVKSYKELERMQIQTQNKLREIELRGGIKDTDMEDMKEELATIEEEMDKELEKVDFGNMEPKDFAKMQFKKYLELHQKLRAVEKRRDQDKKSKEMEYHKVQEEYQKNIQKEINEVAKEFPIIREDSPRAESFRNLVADIITAARSRGENIGLKAGVIRAKSAIGEEVVKIKQPRPLESTQPYTPGQNKTEEEAMKERMLNMGSSRTLGGL